MISTKMDVMNMIDVHDVGSLLNSQSCLSLFDQVLQKSLPCNVQLFRPFRTRQHCYFTHGSGSFPGCCSPFAHVEVTSVFSHPGIELLIGRYHQNVQRYLGPTSLPKIDMMNKFEKSYKYICF